jgi:metal-sulfur cluster biosynthetic enzyme
MEHAQEEIEQATADNIRQQISEMYDPEIDTPPTKPESAIKK